MSACPSAFRPAWQHLFLLAACSLLAACANPSLDKLRNTPANGTPFQNALAQQYLRYAESKQNAEQVEKATLFANKGLAAASGTDVEPEMVENWNIPEEIKPNFVSARAQIMNLVNETTKATKAEAAAGAVFSYDCWLDQTSIAPNSVEAGYCESQMQNAITELSSTTNDMAIDETTQVPMDATAANRYVVYFALNEFVLDDAAKAVLQQAYSELSRLGSVTIAVNGHTDTSGNDRYNMMLSNQRANSVKQMLVTLGTSESQINTFGFGETDLAVPTPDDTYEPRNRRVEIVKN